MSKSLLHSYPKTHNTHSVLIGAPLLIVLAFAFGFVLLQPVSSANSRLTSASQPAASKAGASKAALTASVTPAPLPQASLPTLTPAPITSNTSSGGNDSSATTTPQAAASSSGSSASSPTTSANLQAAVPNNQTANTKSLSTKSSSPASILTNLLNRL